jgi:glycosyltransferase involved in cell wall biosynthesis
LGSREHGALPGLNARVAASNQGRETVRVVQVGKYYYPYVGGIESHLYTLCHELHGVVDMDVIVSNTQPWTSRDVHEGISVTRCAAYGKVMSTSLSPGMVWELSQRDYDIVQVHLPHPVGAAAYLASRKPLAHRLIVTYHSDIVKQKRLMPYYDRLVWALLERAEKVLATSPNYVDTSPTLQRFRDKCEVVPYGIDLALFAKTKEREEEAARIRARYGDVPLLVGVGRLIYYKGFEYAIRALARVPRAELLLIGDGPLRPELEKLARELGVAGRVHLLGEMQNSEIPPYYFASDLYLLPSIARSEAFGIVQLEAMACGLPVLNTDLPSGVPFVSRHGESGLTVPPSDVAALANAIEALIADPARRAEMSRAARARVETDFSKATLARRMRAIYGV